ncbi:hypothetical protein NO2_0351 [Candidatus Termititenax persephonae]|uniref:Glutamyl-tRNA amidotransferase n=1 Tax=Candidatus Termititenax persephonae TaxID=2218525 RepID=A0A388TGD4_9BACT|nr:hypothetical protein NO2_0351 [Candidatus Termititenax persephonae]
MSIVENLNAEIKTAMKEKNAKRLGVVRMLKSKILNVNARGEVSEAEAVKIIKTYAKSLQEAVALAKTAGRTDTAAEVEAELAIVKEYLPPELSAEQLEDVLQGVVSELGKDKAKFGLLMKTALGRLGGQADGALVKDMLNKLLG